MLVGALLFSFTFTQSLEAQTAATGAAQAAEPNPESSIILDDDKESPNAAERGPVNESTAARREAASGEGTQRPATLSAGDNIAVSSPGWVLVRMVLVLLLAALAIYGVVFLVKKFSRPKTVVDPYLKVLAHTPLGNGAFAAVLSVGSKAWLVAGGEGGVNLISEISEKEVLETMLIDESRRSSLNLRFPDFGSFLNKFIHSSGQNFTNSPSPSANASDQISALKQQRDRLRGL
jgi:flagellar protein FliO/FliZ